MGTNKAVINNSNKAIIQLNINNNQNSGEKINKEVMIHIESIEDKKWVYSGDAKSLYLKNDLFNRSFFQDKLSIPIISIEKMSVTHLGNFKIGRNGIGAKNEIRINRIIIKNGKEIKEMIHSYENTLKKTNAQRPEIYKRVIKIRKAYNEIPQEDELKKQPKKQLKIQLKIQLKKHFKEARGKKQEKQAIVLKINNLYCQLILIYAVLLHEMIHQWQHEITKQEVDVYKNYHNVEFLIKSAELGIPCDKKGHLLNIKSNSPFLNILKKDGMPIDEKTSYKFTEIEKTKGKSKLKKYSCGCTNIRVAKQGFRAKCLNCNNEFMLVE